MLRAAVSVAKLEDPHVHMKDRAHSYLIRKLWWGAIEDAPANVPRIKFLNLLTQAILLPCHSN